MSKQVFFLGGIGGQVGSPFEDGPIPNDVHVIGWTIRYGEYINSVQLLYSNSKSSQQHGGNSGDLHQYLLGKGEAIEVLHGKSGIYVDKLIIKTNVQSYIYGGEGGSNDYSFQIPQGSELVGFFGRSGIYVDRLGAIHRELWH